MSYMNDYVTFGDNILLNFLFDFQFCFRQI